MTTAAETDDSAIVAAAHLEQLADEGLIERLSAHEARVYRMTDAGRTRLAELQRLPEDCWIDRRKRGAQADI